MGSRSSKASGGSSAQSTGAPHVAIGSGLFTPTKGALRAAGTTHGQRVKYRSPDKPDEDENADLSSIAQPSPRVAYPDSESRPKGKKAKQKSKHQVTTEKAKQALPPPAELLQQVAPLPSASLVPVPLMAPESLPSVRPNEPGPRGSALLSSRRSLSQPPAMPPTGTTAATHVSLESRGGVSALLPSDASIAPSGRSGLKTRVVQVASRRSSEEVPSSSKRAQVLREADETMPAVASVTIQPTSASSSAASSKAGSVVSSAGSSAVSSASNSTDVSPEKEQPVRRFLAAPAAGTAVAAPPPPARASLRVPNGGSASGSVQVLALSPFDVRSTALPPLLAGPPLPPPIPVRPTAGAPATVTTAFPSHQRAASAPSASMLPPLPISPRPSYSYAAAAPSSSASSSSSIVFFDSFAYQTQQDPFSPEKSLSVVWNPSSFGCMKKSLLLAMDLPMLLAPSRSQLDLLWTHFDTIGGVDRREGFLSKQRLLFVAAELHAKLIYQCVVDMKQKEGVTKWKTIQSALQREMKYLLPPIQKKEKLLAKQQPQAASSSHPLPPSTGPQLSHLKSTAALLGRLMDLNGDGRVSRQEFLTTWPTAAKAVLERDRSKEKDDGVIACTIQ